MGCAFTGNKGPTHSLSCVTVHTALLRQNWRGPINESDRRPNSTTTSCGPHNSRASRATKVGPKEVFGFLQWWLGPTGYQSRVE
ncbi:LOW QUALITY PROTEIN: hypothetical protein TorRG33x02_190270 [Trema orientale]|uniref:Uncharacterized protein n=1 Tax=Trema orientale TaxID=63057 RepID=A0A2P5EI34_TREOI|nr:LOW QUALITY PROTEIN: hypothetical protein TorRG33x02_190270 [Trema orientale]